MDIGAQSPQVLGEDLDVRTATGLPEATAPSAGVELIVGAGCFWGVERLFWGEPGVLETSVGYAGGTTENPTYPQVCMGTTGHAEVVRIVFDPTATSTERLVTILMENHDPTQGNRQGNDIGTQYRSCVFAADDAQLAAVQAFMAKVEPRFAAAGFGPLTTQVDLLAHAGNGTFYLAEEYHQKYLAKNPGGYCNHGPNGVRCG